MRVQAPQACAAARSLPNVPPLPPALPPAHLRRKRRRCLRLRLVGLPGGHGWDDQGGAVDVDGGALHVERGGGGGEWGLVLGGGWCGWGWGVGGELVTVSPQLPRPAHYAAQMQRQPQHRR